MMHKTFHARTARRIIAAALAVLVLAGNAIAYATTSKADSSCQVVAWGFFASQRRTLCDSLIRPDGSWQRQRIFWVPRHQVPITCSGTYFITCSGGQIVDQYVISAETYTVTPDTVLPDEPAHLGAVA
ncbi:CDGP domain-containing protein [Mycolicibacterium mucogenicum]|uniref:CDGP domain-containing protein n=1 Tax=Mycolicibacterium mucogenicum DSM 44124 TaxID=1226753 RepID=A0A8H2PJC5_MYCMU|nr:hypothetical protein [Mycolicibacterium mucogenicum]KAB7752782.1 hypothetical protein MMUC44124_26645 [Mycolicibacterium mucogenicum DSM 44124]QPG69118.1 hypothetical protein C1S78_027655 [Mycolicibacterium mucogenicum DSM 44124]